MDHSAEAIDKLRIELLAQRLITRSIIAHLFSESRVPIKEALQSFEDAMLRMSPDVAPLLDEPVEVQREAADLARKRGLEILNHIGPLIAPPRNASRASDGSHNAVRSNGMSMHQSTELLKRFGADESGATAIEYGLIAAGISVAIITVVQGLGTKLASTFTNIKTKLN